MTVLGFFAPLAMAKMRRDKMWRWRCQWCIVTFGALALVVYNGIAHVWLLREPCADRPTLPPPTPAASCEPCAETALIPPDDDPLARLDLRLGRWDASRSYRLHDHAAVGDDYADVSSRCRVCLATQTSIERLGELVHIAAHWSGPISVAVFVAADELRVLRSFVSWLYRCRPELYARLAVHVALPDERPGIPGPGPRWECGPQPPVVERAPDTIQWRARHPYPQNHMRNLARKNCHTPYVFLVDIDIVPSKGMSEALDKFLEKPPKCALCAYVVPTYELDRRVATFPANKSELLRLSRHKLAVPFHRKVFIYNQYASNFSRWEASGGNESSETHVSHNVTNFELLYEPFYVAPDTVPPHDERFLGYGYTRNTQSFRYITMFGLPSTTPNRIRVRVGSTRRDSGGRIVRVANITVHPLYGRPMYDNDIAALRLARPLAWTRAIRPIRLPQTNQRIPLVRLTVTGWGLTAPRGRRIPRVMMEARVPVVPHWLCRLSYGNTLTNNMFCGGHFLIGGVSSCQVYEMFMIGYQFRVLSPIFTIHWGLQSRRYRPMWREKQNERNRKHFETFKRELFARYRKDPLHLLRKPPPKKVV